MFLTDAFKKMQGESGGAKGIDNDIVDQSFDNVGAWILSRNRFGVLGPPPTIPGTGGGETIRLTIRRYMCSRITRERRC